MTIDKTAPICFKQPLAFADNTKEAKLKKSCDDFEAIIMRQILKVMRESVPQDGLFGEKSFATEMYQGLHDDAMADGLAHGKGAGLGELLFRQLSGRLQPPPPKGE